MYNSYTILHTYYAGAYALIVIRFQYNLCMIHVQLLYYITYILCRCVCSDSHMIPVQFMYDSCTITILYYMLSVIRFQYHLCAIHVQFLYYITYYHNTIPVCSDSYMILVQFMYDSCTITILYYMRVHML